MAKKIIVNVDGTGKMNVEFDGYQGNSCFSAAQEFQHFLKVFGVDADVIKIDPKKNEVETRRLENSQTVGR